MKVQRPLPKSVLVYDWYPARNFLFGRTGFADRVILHTTVGASNVGPEVLSTLPQSFHWYVRQNGDILHMVSVRNTAFHCDLPAEPAFHNNYTIGVLLEHQDGFDAWSNRQVKALGQLLVAMRQIYAAPLPVYSHGDVTVTRCENSEPVDFPWDYLHECEEASSRFAWQMRLRGAEDF